MAPRPNGFDDSIYLVPRIDRILARTVSHAGAFGFNPSKCPEFCIIVTVTESPAFFAAVA